MSTTRDLFTSAFGEEFDLYRTVLRVDRRASTAQIRKAYHKRALQYHPDKQSPASSPEHRDEAKLKFQAVSLAHEILSRDETRSLYDETGEFYHDDNDDDTDSRSSGVEQWLRVFSKMFGQVTEQSIGEFEQKYKGSEEERRDVLKYYESCRGDFDKMLTCVMLSEEEDQERWQRDYIRPAVKKGKVKDYAGTQLSSMNANNDDDDEADSDEDTVTEDEDDKPSSRQPSSSRSSSRGRTTTPSLTKKNKKSSKKQQTQKSRKQEKEAREAQELLAKIRGGSLARKKREQNFNSLLSNMEAKYGGGSSGSSNGPSADLSNDEFERIQKQLGGKRKRG